MKPISLRRGLPDEVPQGPGSPASASLPVAGPSLAWGLLLAYCLPVPPAAPHMLGTASASGTAAWNRVELSQSRHYAEIAITVLSSRAATST